VNLICCELAIVNGEFGSVGQLICIHSLPFAAVCFFSHKAGIVLMRPVVGNTLLLIAAYTFMISKDITVHRNVYNRGNNVKA